MPVGAHSLDHPPDHPPDHAPDSLQHDPDWTRSEQGRPLSLWLPFMPGNLPHCGPHVRAWFEKRIP